MPTALPQRPPEHQLEETSISFFKQHLPQGWILEEPRPDYGIDVRVGIVDNNQLTGREFIVQVKASPTREAGNTVKLVLKVTTLNYLRHSLNVALVVKYVAAEQQAYWMLLKDFKLQPRPGLARRLSLFAFRVRIVYQTILGHASPNMSNMFTTRSCGPM